MQSLKRSLKSSGVLWNFFNNSKTTNAITLKLSGYYNIHFKLIRNLKPIKVSYSAYSQINSNFRQELPKGFLIARTKYFRNFSKFSGLAYNGCWRNLISILSTRGMIFLKTLSKHIQACQHLRRILKKLGNAIPFMPILREFLILYRQ